MRSANHDGAFDMNAVTSERFAHSVLHEDFDPSFGGQAVLEKTRLGAVMSVFASKSWSVWFLRAAIPPAIESLEKIPDGIAILAV